MILQVLLFLIILLTCSLAFAFLFQRKLEETYILSCTLFIAILYVSGLLANFKVGTRIIYLLFFLASLYTIIHIIKAPDRTVCKHTIFSFGLFALLFYAVLFFWINYDRILYSWDEFSHWGLVTKNIYLMNDYAFGERSTVYFKGYPPATSLLAYFIQQLGGTTFHENSCYFAQDILMISFLLPVFSHFNIKKGALEKDTIKKDSLEKDTLENTVITIDSLKISALKIATQKETPFKKDVFIKRMLLLGILTILPLAFNTNAYTSLYVDVLLGVEFAGILWTYFSRERLERFDTICILLELFVLSITKASGVGLACIAVLIIIIDFYCNKDSDQIKNRIKKGMATLLVLIQYLLPVLIGKFSWSLFLHSNHVDTAWNTSSVTFHNILSTFYELIGKGERTYRWTVCDNFAKALLNETIGFLPFIQWLAVFAILYILTKYMLKNRRAARFILCGTMGSFLYLLSLFVLYLYTYSEYEAVYLASFERYAGTYILGFLAVSILLILQQWNTKPILFLFLLFLLFNSNSIYGVRSIPLARQISTIDHANREKYTEATNQICSLPEDSNVYLISQNNRGFDFWNLRFLCTPIKCEGWASLGDAYYKGDIWTQNMTLEEWREELLQGGYTDVYLFNVDEQFITRYGSLFRDQAQIKNNTLYHIHSENGFLLDTN